MVMLERRPKSWIGTKLENAKYRDALRAFLEKARSEATVEISPAYRNRLHSEDDETETSAP